MVESHPIEAEEPAALAPEQLLPAELLDESSGVALAPFVDPVRSEIVEEAVVDDRRCQAADATRVLQEERRVCSSARRQATVRPVMPAPSTTIGAASHSLRIHHRYHTFAAPALAALLADAEVALDGPGRALRSPALSRRVTRLEDDASTPQTSKLGESHSGDQLM